MYQCPGPRSRASRTPAEEAIAAVTTARRQRPHAVRTSKVDSATKATLAPKRTQPGPAPSMLSKGPHTRRDQDRSVVVGEIAAASRANWTRESALMWPGQKPVGPRTSGPQDAGREHVASRRRRAGAEASPFPLRRTALRAKPVNVAGLPQESLVLRPYAKDIEADRHADRDSSRRGRAGRPSCLQPVRPERALRSTFVREKAAHAGKARKSTYAGCSTRDRPRRRTVASRQRE